MTSTTEETVPQENSFTEEVISQLCRRDYPKFYDIDDVQENIIEHCQLIDEILKWGHVVNDLPTDPIQKILAYMTNQNGIFDIVNRISLDYMDQHENNEAIYNELVQDCPHLLAIRKSYLLHVLKQWLISMFMENGIFSYDGASFLRYGLLHHSHMSWTDSSPIEGFLDALDKQFKFESRNCKTDYSMTMFIKSVLPTYQDLGYTTDACKFFNLFIFRNL